MTAPKVNRQHFVTVIIWGSEEERFQIKKLRRVILQAYLTYAKSVQAGAQRGIEECKHQFAWDKWNCPDSATQLRGLRRGRSR